MFNTNQNIGPYTSVSCEIKRTFKGHGEYRIAIYGAYNAYGLIGPEKNGLVVLDETKRAVLCDEIEKADSGYFGPTKGQYEAMAAFKAMKWPEFREFINTHNRARYSI